MRSKFENINVRKKFKSARLVGVNCQLDKNANSNIENKIFVCIYIYTLISLKLLYSRISSYYDEYFYSLLFKCKQSSKSFVNTILQLNACLSYKYISNW